MAKRKPSKWAKLRDTLPKYLGTDPGHQAKVDALKREIKNPNGNRPDGTSADAIIAAELQNINGAMKAISEALKHAPEGPLTALELASCYRKARHVKEEIDAHLHIAELYLTTYIQLMCDSYQTEDVTTRYFPDGTAVRVQPEPYASVEDKVKFHKWCLDNGYEDEMTLPWGTVNATTKELLDKGLPQPDGIKIWFKEKVVLAQGKDKGEDE